MLSILLVTGHLIASGTRPLPIDRRIGRHEWRQIANTTLPVTTDRIWVKVRRAISIGELADKLAQDETKLAMLNDVDEDHSFSSGDWLVIPSQSIRKAKQLAALDSSEMRRTPPLEAANEPQKPARIRLGDSLAKIASRYNLSISELLRLNPGLQAANLVPGTQIRVATSTPGRSRMILGLKPTTSGDLSWPELGDHQASSGISSIGLVGPFKRTPEAFARFLNSKPKTWEDPSLRTYFYDLYNCHSYVSDGSNAMPQSYRCTGGYVNYSDNLGSRRCRLDYVSWTWKEGQSFKSSTCK
ncbi:MAG: LysM peptidoglycan-binding domain-containing protein [Synechococcus sp.]|nr:LysM peptidoglycan-binding domain-containing protein [Synechococcus sp.]